MTADNPNSRLVDIVFGLPRPERRRRVVVALVAAGVLHGALWLWAAHSEPTLESWSAVVAARVHSELSRVESVELARPPPAPAPEQTPPPPGPVRQRAGAHQTEAAKPSPPAQASSIVAQAPEPSGPVDLSPDTFVTGTAIAYGGGVTTATGTSTTAVTTRDVVPGAHSNPEEDHSATVGLDESEWSCPWPRDAEDETGDEQVVVLQVAVRADGTVESAHLASDPGHGFGQAALTCALSTRFSPALDRRGRAIAARSPPIRVRFTR